MSKLKVSIINSLCILIIQGVFLYEFTPSSVVYAAEDTLNDSRSANGGDLGTLTSCSSSSSIESGTPYYTVSRTPTNPYQLVYDTYIKKQKLITFTHDQFHNMGAQNNGQMYSKSFWLSIVLTEFNDSFFTDDMTYCLFTIPDNQKRDKYRSELKYNETEAGENIFFQDLLILDQTQDHSYDTNDTDSFIRNINSFLIKHKNHSAFKYISGWRDAITKEHIQKECDLAASSLKSRSKWTKHIKPHLYCISAFIYIVYTVTKSNEAVQIVFDPETQTEKSDQVLKWMIEENNNTLFDLLFCTQENLTTFCTFNIFTTREISAESIFTAYIVPIIASLFIILDHGVSLLHSWTYLYNWFCCNIDIESVDSVDNNIVEGIFEKIGPIQDSDLYKKKLKKIIANLPEFLKTRFFTDKETFLEEIKNL